MDGLDHTFGLLHDDAGSSRLDADWAGFCAALGVDAAAAGDAAAIAHALAARPAGAAAAAAAFRQVADALGIEPAAARLGGLVAAVAVTLPDAALSAVLSAMEAGQRRPFMRAVVPSFPPPAVLALCSAAGAAAGQPLSGPLRRLLQKLRAEAESLPPDRRGRADQSFRSLVLQLVETWAASTVNTAAAGYDALFEDQEERRRTRVTPEPLRVVQLSLESGAMGNVVWGAVAEQARSEDGMRDLLDMLQHAPPDSAAASAVVGHIATPARLGILLQEDPVDFGAVDVLVRHMGVDAVRPLLDALVEAKPRSTRRALMDRLAALGPPIGAAVTERLGDERWYVVRNMLTLLREAGCPPAQLPVERLSAHADARVRRETLQLQLEDPAARDAALVQALQDTDRHVLRTALQAARSQLPQAAVPILAQRVTAATFPPEFRVIALFLLGRSGSIKALDTLIAFVHGGTTLFGRPKLAPTSPEMLAALGGLARSWPNERRATALLALARSSNDPQILNALKSTPAASDRTE